MGDDAPTQLEPDDPSSANDEQVVEGIGVTSGIVIGTACPYEATPEVRRWSISSDEVASEIDLLDEAVEQAERELETIRSVAEASLGEASRAIFEAQVLMLRDEELLGVIRERIREKNLSAGAAVQSVLDTHRERIEASEDAYLRDRAEDLIDLEHRLLQSLQRGRTVATIDPDSVLVTETLSAADLVRFHRHGLRGCVMAQGGATSHVSIIARALEVPTLVGVEGGIDSVPAQSPVILDGERGRLVVHPSPETLAAYRERRARREQRHRQQVQAASLPAETRDGHSILLRANVEFGEELDALDRFGADGIGLMRTEMVFLAGTDGGLTEERQADVYREAAQRSGAQGATIRLLDLGGDRLLPLGQKEANPFLGWRGIRVLLDRPDQLLRPQLRALLRANAHGSLRVLLPMVADLSEVRRVRTLLEEEATRLSDEGREHDSDLPLGVMVEVPATALRAEAFSEVVDFFSVGTNDLTQYVLAVDRGNDRVANRYEALHPAVLRLIARTVEAGGESGCPVTVCGEIAGDVEALPILLGLGVDVLSAAPPSLPSVKRVLRHLRMEEAQALADDALAAEEAQEVRQRAREWLLRHEDLDIWGEEASSGTISVTEGS